MVEGQTSVGMGQDSGGGGDFGETACEDAPHTEGHEGRNAGGPASVVPVQMCGDRDSKSSG